MPWYKEKKGHRPGDRWQQEAWPAGTPDAVVREVKRGYVYWEQRGGCHQPRVPAALLTRPNGWRRVPPTKKKEQAYQEEGGAT